MKSIDNVISAKILVYQDEDCTALIDYLKYSKFKVITSTESDVLNKIKECEYDICIFSHHKTSDASMKLKPLKYLRKFSNKLPVIMLSDKAEYEDIIEAFDEGADDYVIRPYNAEELIRRIKAVLKRTGLHIRKIDPIYEIGDYIFNAVINTLTIGNTEMNLTKKQGGVLAMLCAYKNTVVLKKAIMQQVWLEDNRFNRRSLDVYIYSLRDMLKKDNRIHIETVKGIGYSLVVEGEDEI